MASTAFTAASTNTNLVSATVQGGVLTLRLLPDASGVAVVNVTASDGALSGRRSSPST
jgi:hypothetical protein